MNDNVRVYHVDEYCEGASHFSFSERKDVVLFEDYEKLREENERLKGENAKMKCLVMHLFVRVGYHEYKDWGRIRDLFSESKLKERCARNADRWRRINKRSYEAYRKAKAKLRFSNG